MAGAMYRGKQGLVFWESENCTLCFETEEMAPGSPGIVERFGKAAGRTPYCVQKDSLVDMEGNVDLADLDAVLESAVTELNLWLQSN